ncbi:unnamed protein product [Lactuca saligna]|uniref:Uncharacterized protein n=1 Tax=Lactuca saligna TaxID=75948 RepID=A0AA36EP42_LACSI|nr:unnamed protein product [Lactuca saligna]
MFDDDSSSIGALPIFSTYKSLQAPSFSKPVYDYHLSSSSSQHEDEEIQIDDKFQATQGNETETNPPQGNQTTKNTSPSKPHEDKGGDNNDDKSESSTSDTSSSDEKITELFALLEL